VSAPPTGVKAVLKEVLRTKSGVVAFALLIFIASLAILVPIWAPYDVVKKWNDQRAWIENPRVAAPEWVEFFVGKKLPKTIKLYPDDFKKRSFVVTYKNLTMKKIYLSTSFRYKYDDFPSEFRFFLFVRSKGKVEVTVRFIRPDRSEIVISGLTLENGTKVIDSTDELVLEKTTEFVKSITGREPVVVAPEVYFFAVKSPDMYDISKVKVLKGTYRVDIEVTGFSEEDDVDVKLIIYGKVYGLAGTDDMRRDLMIGILWGAPVALAFGLITAICVTLLQTIFGIISGFYGGKVDEIIQRITDVMMIIPLLPILILISFFYRPGIFSLILVLIAFGFVGTTTKVVRSMVLQIREEPCIEAAKSYGASNWRIILRHIFPRVLPYTFSIISISVPVYIFTEAALSFLGLGDPVLPTWGKILGDAEAAGAPIHGYWWWVLIPAGFISLTAAAFALLGYAFDKVVNPRLREM